MREYRNKDIIVYWYPELCAHLTTCFHTLPEVFRPKERPWVRLEEADPEAIIECIDKCASGALKYSLPEGSSVDPGIAHGPGSADNTKDTGACGAVRIKYAKDMPCFIEGPAEVISCQGESIYKGQRITLCSCGRTENPPFCDGSHRKKD